MDDSGLFLVIGAGVVLLLLHRASATKPVPMTPIRPQAHTIVSYFTRPGPPQGTPYRLINKP